MLDITLEQIEAVLGEKGKKVGHDYVFQCRVCMDEGKNNLIFSPGKKLLKCFSCANNEGGQYVLDLINKCSPKSKPNDKQKLVYEQPRFLDKELQEQYVEYMAITNDYLLEHSDLLDLLYKKRGIDKQTVKDCGIGYDDTEDHWVIPIFSLKYDGMIMGFEYRRKNFDKYDNGSKVRRERGYIADICPVWGCKKAKTLYILEGFLDAMCLHQYLRERRQTDYTIYSCSNGVSSLLNVMNRIYFANFNEVKLMLDTDKAGCEITNKIIGQYPFIKDVRGFLFERDVKDFGEFYKGIL